MKKIFMQALGVAFVFVLVKWFVRDMVLSVIAIFESPHMPISEVLKSVASHNGFMAELAIFFVFALFLIVNHIMGKSTLKSDRIKEFVMVVSGTLLFFDGCLGGLLRVNLLPALERDDNYALGLFVMSGLMGLFSMGLFILGMMGKKTREERRGLAYQGGLALLIYYLTGLLNMNVRMDFIIIQLGLLSGIIISAIFLRKGMGGYFKQLFAELRWLILAMGLLIFLFDGITLIELFNAYSDIGFVLGHVSNLIYGSLLIAVGLITLYFQIKKEKKVI